MKRVFFYAFFILYSNSITARADLTDSTEKYKGTKYIGDIFKKYDYLPETINQPHQIYLTNNLGIPLEQGDPFYDIGLRYLYQLPLWQEGPITWNSGSLGAYFRYSPTKYGIYSFGFSAAIIFDSPIYIILNEGLFYGMYDKEGASKDKLTDVGFEISMGIGYKLFINDWFIAPEILLAMAMIPSSRYYYYSFIKPPLQINLCLNAGKRY